MKRLWFAPVLLLASGTLMAAEQVEHTVTVTAQIPTANFYVQPVGDWMNTPQKLTFNRYQSKLEPLSKQLELKSTLGAIKGYLVYPPSMASGANSIDLAVKVASKTLGTTSIELLNAADALAGKKAQLEITAAAPPEGGYLPGNYQGIVSMMFESEAPPAPPAT